MAKEQIILFDSFFASISNGKNIEIVQFCKNVEEKHQISIYLKDFSALTTIQDLVIPVLNVMNKRKLNAEQDEEEKDEEEDDDKRETNPKKKLRLEIPTPTAEPENLPPPGETDRAMKKVLHAMFVEEAAKRWEEVVKENCFGCIYDCPSQRDHDLMSCTL